MSGTSLLVFKKSGSSEAGSVDNRINSDNKTCFDKGVDRSVARLTEQKRNNPKRQLPSTSSDGFH